MFNIMAYLVICGAGFIGSHIARQVVRLGRSVKVVDNLSSGSLKTWRILYKVIHVT